MSKILTVCIPSYNMEKYLGRNLESFVTSNCLEKLEIIVVNDGSKDGTLKIANEYKLKYPNAIVVLDKSNGHYGSCVNAALKIASGKYFRIVDADDWVETKNIPRLIETLGKCETDAIFTKYIFRNEGGGDSVQKTEGIDFDKNLSLDDYVIPDTCLEMHSYTYNTNFLKAIKYEQTEGVCYTDTEYIYFPLSRARDLYCIDIILYNYYNGREGQSVKSMLNNFPHFSVVINSILSKKVSFCNNNHMNIKNALLLRLFISMLNIHLIGSNLSAEREKMLRIDLARLNQTDAETFDNIMNLKYHGLNYYKNWFNKFRIFTLQHFFLHFLYIIRKG